MKKYIIEREIPGAGSWTAEKLKEVSGVSCGVLSHLGPQIQWVHSYVVIPKKIDKSSYSIGFVE